MSDFMQMINASSKRACIDEKLLKKESLQLHDTRNFLQSIRDDIATTRRRLPAVELALILTVTTTMVLDVIRDSAGEAGGKLNPILKPINWVYDKARKYRDQNSNNRFKKHFENIDKVVEAVEKSLPKNEVGRQIGLTLKLFARLAKNTAVLITAMEDSNEARKVVVKSLSDLDKQLKLLDEKISRKDHWLTIGESFGQVERMSRAPAPRRLP
ncbi:MAG TPA: hypothetical protein VK629_05385 [Steroidobacteraceae bacterium]|nr:hypothetical protein [Steroidobacteraceae bacterium]